MNPHLVIIDLQFIFIFIIIKNNRTSNKKNRIKIYLYNWKHSKKIRYIQRKEKKLP